MVVSIRTNCEKGVWALLVFRKQIVNKLLVLLSYLQNGSIVILSLSQHFITYMLCWHFLLFRKAFRSRTEGYVIKKSIKKRSDYCNLYFFHDIFNKL